MCSVAGISNNGKKCLYETTAENGKDTNTLTLGSLFDGIGGFPLAATRYGIVPVWASEIESFPIEVTKYHFPNMIHAGDITRLHGEELPPVDIICGGSPCQDLSVAGAGAGLGGSRSGLFVHQIRIIREMLNADKQRGRTGIYVRPRYGVWENVSGAFSSGRNSETGEKDKGQDFQTVLKAFMQIEEPHFRVIRPATGCWKYAGAILGVRSSLVWANVKLREIRFPPKRSKASKDTPADSTFNLIMSFRK